MPLPHSLHFQHLGRAGGRFSGLYADGGGKKKKMEICDRLLQERQQQRKGVQVTDRLKLKWKEHKPERWIEKAQLGMSKWTEVLFNHV